MLVILIKSNICTDPGHVEASQQKIYQKHYMQQKLYRMRKVGEKFPLKMNDFMIGTSAEDATICWFTVNVEFLFSRSKSHWAWLYIWLYSKVSTCTLYSSGCIYSFNLNTKSGSGLNIWTCKYLIQGIIGAKCYHSVKSCSLRRQHTHRWPWHTIHINNHCIKQVRINSNGLLS